MTSADSQPSDAVNRPGKDHVDRRGLLRGAGIAAALGLAVPVAGRAVSADAAPPAGSMIAWVGPAGSGATYEVDASVGAQGAINQALAANPRGAVFIQAGSYTIKSPITIGDRQALFGAGPLTTLLTAAATMTAMIQTASGSTASRMVIHDLGLEAASKATSGIALQIADDPTSYGPDPDPWLDRVFVSNTIGDGIYLYGAYAGGEREFKISNCRVEHAGGWGYNLNSSDGFISGCSVQGCKTGGYNLAQGNIKCWGNKAYTTGDSASSTPGPAFRVTARATVTGCEAQDTYGCGFELLGPNITIEGCSADSTGSGTNNRYAAGFFVYASAIRLSGTAYQRPNGAGAMRVSVLIQGTQDYLSIDVVGNATQQDNLPVAGLSGNAGSHSKVNVISVV